MHSIRFKITAITIAEILTAMLCVFLVSFSIIQAENDRRSVEMMDVIAQDTQKALEKYTDNIENSVETLGNLASDKVDSTVLLQNGIQAGVGVGTGTGRTPEQATQIDTYISEYTNDLLIDSASVANHTHGVVCYYYCINPDVSTVSHGFFYSRVGKTGFAEQPPLDARELDRTDMEHFAWYFTPIERGRPTWVGPYKAHFINEMSLCSYLVPIYKSGIFIGLFGMDIPTETLVSLVSSTRVYNTGFVSLLDADGRVIYHPSLSLGSELNLPIDERVLEQENNGSQLIRYNSEGQEQQLSFTTLSNGMKLLVVAPVSEINASSMRLIGTIPPVALLVTAVIAALSLVVMHFITRPLLRLTAASQRLAAADYDVELDYRGRDEVGALTAAFKQMRDQLQAYIEDLNRRINADDLTGLPNQRYFFRLADEERIRMLQAGLRPVTLYINLVGMKHFNRQYGFDKGDHLICETADVLARHFGVGRTSRFGQDQFAILTDDTNLMERIYAVFEDCKSINGGNSLPVSVGIYRNELEDVSVSVACDRAKYACDRRRGSYFSGCCFFDESMIRQLELLRHVVSHLDQAIEENWIQVYYQPIVRAVNGRVCDEEALSRWIDPERGFLSPADFIPALEDSGLIYKLDLYVLEQVLEKIRNQSKAGLTIVPHSVNLSRSDFDSCDMVDEICKRVDAAGVSRDMITIEITESIIGSDFKFMKTQVERFQSLGFPVWMDDFGSGYSSLDYLQSIQFDLIKFDMSFLRKLDDGKNGRIILTELMQMATALGVDTICEGVETKEQVRFLQEIGCSKLQGYYYCKPISLEGLLERYDKGEQIGYENPKESDYFATIGKANLYDLATITHKDQNALQNIFNTIPMGILEISGNEAVFARTNQSFRSFVYRCFGSEASDLENDAPAFDIAGSFFAKYVHECCDKGEQSMFEEELSDQTFIRFLARRIGTSPVSGTAAVAIAVLSVLSGDEGVTYANIARALAMDYFRIYYADLDTGHYIEYSSPADGSDDLAVERHGDDFFADVTNDAMRLVSKEERPVFMERFTRENILEQLEEQGTFIVTYDLSEGGSSMVASMKVTRLRPSDNRIIIGVSIKG